LYSRLNWEALEYPLEKAVSVTFACPRHKAASRLKQTDLSLIGKGAACGYQFEMPMERSDAHADMVRSFQYIWLDTGHFAGTGFPLFPDV
jgi:hypothetical protein